MRIVLHILTFVCISVGTLHTHAQEDTLVIPPTKVIIKTNLAGLMPNYALHYSKPSISLEYYAGKDISVGVTGGTYFTNAFKQFPYQQLFQKNLTVTNVFGGYFNLEFRRFFGDKERSKHAHLLSPLIALQNKNTKAENTGYYLGILLTEKFTTVFYDVKFGQSTIGSSRNYFNFSFDITIGYQSISNKGWVLDQTLGLGFTKGTLLTESLVEYNLFKNITSEIYPHLSYSFRVGKEFVREYKLRKK